MSCYNLQLIKTFITLLNNVLVVQNNRIINNQEIIQSSKLAGSPKSEASEIMLRTSETILALVRSD